MICTAVGSLDSEINFISNYLWNNSFPWKLIQTKISKFHKNIMSERLPIHTVRKEKLFISICQFRGNSSSNFRHKMMSLIGRYFPEVDLRIIFTNNYRIKSYFPSRPRTLHGLNAGIVYLYNCGGCNSSYIGKSTRHLTVRIHEHMGSSARTGKRFQVPPLSYQGTYESRLHPGACKLQNP